jgi:hypothetical protein
MKFVYKEAQVKKLHYGLVLGLLLTLNFAHTAKADTEEIVDIQPLAFYVPVGFDDNDEVIAVVDGYLPDTCYRIRSAQVKHDLVNNRIIVQPKAVRFPGTCMDVTVPYSTEVRLGTLAEGSYQVATKSGQVSERLEVKEATHEKADDYLYAPVDTVDVQTLAGGKMQAKLMGRFTDTCLRFREVKVTNSGKTLEVLPVMKRVNEEEAGNKCEKREVPFEEVVQLPQLNPGRYLLHVRSLNGQSVNEVFAVRR